LAIGSVFTPVLAKHSKSFSLIDCISVGVDRMQRNFEPLGISAQTYSPQWGPTCKKRTAPLRKDTDALRLPNIAHLITYGEITVGRQSPIGCIATACAGN